MTHLLQRILIRDRIPARTLAVLPKRHIQRGRRRRDLSQLTQDLRLRADQLSEFSQSGATSVFGLEPLFSECCLPHQLTCIDRQPDEPPFISKCPDDGLANPPVHVRAEAEPFAPVVLIDASLQTDIALLDEVQQTQAASLIVARNGEP